MKKRILIAIFIVSTLVLSYFLFSYLNKGFLKLDINTQKSEVQIDKKKYKASNGFSKKLSPGKHFIRVSEEGYEDYVETITINRRETSQKKIELEKTDLVISRITKNFITDLTTIPALNPDLYLKKLEEATTKEYFPYLEEKFASKNPGKKTGYSKTNIIETKVQSINSDSAEVLIIADVESLNPKISSSPFTIRYSYSIQLKKENNKWFVNWLLADVLS